MAKRDLVQRPVAQLDVAVAGAVRRRGGGGRRRCPRTIPTTAMIAIAGSSAGREPAPADAPLRTGLGARHAVLLLAVDEPQDRAHALVDQVDPERAQQQVTTASMSTSTSTPAATKASPRTTRHAGRLRLAGDPARGRAERRAERQRPDQRRRGRRHHRARAGEDPGRGAQVAEEGVPDRAGRRLLVRSLDVVDRDRRAGSSRRPRARPPTAASPMPSSITVVRRSGESHSAPPASASTRMHEEERQQPDPLGDVAERRR